MRKILLSALGALFSVGALASTNVTPTATLFLQQVQLTAAPTFSPNAGSYTSTQSVTISDATAGSTIFCTLDGSLPTKASPVCSGTITVSSTETIRAIAVASGYGYFPASSAAYTIGSGGSGTFGVQVSGNHLINTFDGTPTQLRGVNVSALEGIPYETGLPFGIEDPNPTALASWGINVVRLPVSESNWLGLCSSTLSEGVTPPVYQAAIASKITALEAQKIFVIIDLHWIAVPNTCPGGQNAMADTSYSATFWTQVSTAYKNDPAVLFEMFNEPQGNFPPTTNDWNHYLTGGLTGSQDVGINTLISAVRNAEGTLHHVIIVDGLNYGATFGNNTTISDNPPGFEIPVDSASPAQIAASQHPYGGGMYESGADILLAKGIPIILTEYGDNCGKTCDSDATYVFGWADPGGTASQYLTAHGQDGAHFPGISYVAWVWNWGTGWYNNGQPGNYNDWALIQDSSGTPFSPSADPALGDSSTTPIAYAAEVKSHYLCRKMGSTNCP